MKIFYKAHLYQQDIKIGTQTIECDGRPPVKLERDGETYFLESSYNGIARYQYSPSYGKYIEMQCAFCRQKEASADPICPKTKGAHDFDDIPF